MIFGFMIHSSFADGSECEAIDEPTRLLDCEGEKTEFRTETCCYLKGTLGGESVQECVDIKQEDMKNLEDVKTKLKNGQYWAGYTEKYTNIETLECPESACEAIYEPTGYSDCKDMRSQSDEEKCCYVKAIYQGNEDSWCGDIKKTDESNLDNVKESIKDGTYWAEYPDTYDEVQQLVCGSSSYLTVGFLAFILILL